MISTSELRRTWAGHTAVEQLCDALDRANTSIINWFHNAVYWQRHTIRLRDHWMAAWRRAHQAERERDAARARVVELTQALRDAWNTGEHAGWCPWDTGEQLCLCWHGDVGRLIGMSATTPRDE